MACPQQGAPPVSVMAQHSAEDAIGRMLSMLEGADAKHSLLMQAAARGDEELVQRMLQCFDPDLLLRCDQGGQNPCRAAALHGHAAICRMLLRAHDPKQQLLSSTHFGLTAAMQAACGRHTEAFQQLMAFVPQEQLTQTGVGGCSLLFYAAGQGALPILREALRLAEDPRRLVSHRSLAGVSALSAAAVRGQWEALQLLLPYAADASLMTEALESLAVDKRCDLSEGHKRCCLLLYAHGASVAGLKGERRQHVEAVLREAVATHLASAGVDAAVTGAPPQPAGELLGEQVVEMPAEQSGTLQMLLPPAEPVMGQLAEQPTASPEEEPAQQPMAQSAEESVGQPAAPRTGGPVLQPAGSRNADSGAGITAPVPQRAMLPGEVLVTAAQVLQPCMSPIVQGESHLVLSTQGAPQPQQPAMKRIKTEAA